MMARRFAATATLALCVATACGSTSSTPHGAGACAPGASVLCAGPAGCTGFQVCASDGSGYGPCDCQPGGAVDGGARSLDAAGADAMGAGDALDAGPACAGTPSATSCNQCCNVIGRGCAGCTVVSTGTCGGTPAACNQADITTTPQTECMLLPGCSWQFQPGTCTGTPPPCTSWTTQLACQKAACTWNGPAVCTGTLTPCAQLTAATCSSQVGCVVAGTGRGDAGSD